MAVPTVYVNLIDEIENRNLDKVRDARSYVKEPDSLDIFSTVSTNNLVSNTKLILIIFD